MYFLRFFIMFCFITINDAFCCSLNGIKNRIVNFKMAAKLSQFLRFLAAIFKFISRDFNNFWPQMLEGLL